MRGLGAKRLSIETKAATEDVPMPATLALPIEVHIERVGVAELDWRVGTNRGTIRGLAFGYSGGAAGHRVSDVTFVAQLGTITGNATIAPSAPFAIAGKLNAKGDDALAGTEADLVLAGALDTLTLDATGKAGSSPFTGRATLAPLAATVLREMTLDARAIDLAAWNAALPATALDVAVRASPAAGGLAGTIEATNTAIGTLDAGRVPLSTFSSRFAWRDDALALEAIAAALGGGAITGSARIPLSGAATAGSWTLELRDIDTHKIYAALVPSRLSGTLVADLERQQQRFRVNVTDRTVPGGGIGLEASATLADGAVVVDRFRARSGKGELAGHGRTVLAGDRAFELEATGTRFDPSAYGAFPSGTLDGRIVASGTVAAPWSIRADITLAQGSRLSGVAVAGTARGTLTKTSARDLAVDLSLGRSKLTATGAAGASSDELAVTLDSPEIADLAPLLPARFAQSLAGHAPSQGELRRSSAAGGSRPRGQRRTAEGPRRHRGGKRRDSRAHCPRRLQRFSS